MGCKCRESASTVEEAAKVHATWNKEDLPKFKRLPADAERYEPKCSCPLRQRQLRQSSSSSTLPDELHFQGATTAKTIAATAMLDVFRPARLHCALADQGPPAPDRAASSNVLRVRLEICGVLAAGGMYFGFIKLKFLRFTHNP